MFITEALYVFIPAMLANVAPTVAAAWGLPGAVPISTRLFGAHKTWRGHAASAAVGLVAAFILHLIAVANGGGWVTWYYGPDWWLLGLLMGLGAQLGDTAKSFIKRRLTIPEGAAWFPWDQTDWAFGSILFTLPVLGLVWDYYATILIVAVCLHRLGAIIAYRLGQKRVPW